MAHFDHDRQCWVNPDGSDVAVEQTGVYQAKLRREREMIEFRRDHPRLLACRHGNEPEHCDECALLRSLAAGAGGQ